MNRESAPPTTDQDPAALSAAAEARAKALERVAEIRAEAQRILGHDATSRRVFTDLHGNIITEGDKRRDQADDKVSSAT